MVVGGLGLGFTMHEVLADRRVEKCAVVEIEEALVGWMRDGTVPHGPALLADERATVVVADIAVAMAEARPASYDLVLLDVDNGPGYLVHDVNARLYQDDFLRTVRGAAAGWRDRRVVGGRGARPRRGADACLRRGRGAPAGGPAAGPRRALLALRRAGNVQCMTEFRTEHDSMGEVLVPRDALVAGADPAGGRELPDQRHPDRAAPDPGARHRQAGRRAGQPGPRRPRRGAGAARSAPPPPRWPPVSTTRSSRSTSSRPARAPPPT